MLFGGQHAGKPKLRQGHGRANFMDAYKKGKYPFVFDCIWIFNAPWSAELRLLMRIPEFIKSKSSRECRKTQMW